MPYTKALRLLAVLAATAALSSLPAHANLVTNGDFETGDFSGWTTTGLVPPFDGVDDQNPQSGKFAAFFGNAPPPATIGQTLATVAGTTYNISFWLQNEADVNGTSTPNSFEFDWDGAARLTLVDAGAFGYTNYQFSLVATTASTNLSFSFVQVPAFWDFDTVSVDAAAANTVPEPGTLALAGFGAIALFVSRRRRTVNGVTAAA